MQKETVDFRFSDSDLSAYLLLLGYEPSYIEVINDKRHSRIKAFTHFNGYKDDFIKLQQEYQNSKLDVDLLKFSIARQKINKLIKHEIKLYNRSQSL